MIHIRFVRITFGNGLTVTGVVPAAITDHELNSMRTHGVDLVFSDPHATPPNTPVARLFELGEQSETRLAS